MVEMYENLSVQLSMSQRKTNRKGKDVEIDGETDSWSMQHRLLWSSH